jgi:hypothetical protein
MYGMGSAYPGVVVLLHPVERLLGLGTQSPRLAQIHRQRLQVPVVTNLYILRVYLESRRIPINQLNIIYPQVPVQQLEAKIIMIRSVHVIYSTVINDDVGVKRYPKSVSTRFFGIPYYRTGARGGITYRDTMVRLPSRVVHSRLPHDSIIWFESRRRYYTPNFLTQFSELIVNF